MNYADLTKKFNFQAPSELNHKDLRAKTLTRADLRADMEGVNSSLKLIRKTRGGSWPLEPLVAYVASILHSQLTITDKVLRQHI